MDKQIITEDMHLEKEWYDEADQQTMESLPAFIDKMMNRYEHDYGTVCHAIAACALAVINVGADEEGLTGFQYGVIMWLLIRHGWHPNNQAGMRLINYDKMLYPQYANNFEKKLDRDVFLKLMEMAKEKIQEAESNENKLYTVAEEVMEHWKKIANGEVPFGYTLTEDWEWKEQN